MIIDPLMDFLKSCEQHISLILGIYGAGLSTYIFCKQNKRCLKLKLQISEADALENSEVFILWAVNCGRRPITITSIGLLMNGTSLELENIKDEDSICLEGKYITNPVYPVTLPESQNLKHVIDISMVIYAVLKMGLLEKAGEEEKEPQKFIPYAYDSEGNKYEGKEVNHFLTKK